MSIYHCSAKVISRSQGRSSVAAAAYRSGEQLYNENDGLTHDYTKKQGIEHSEIMLPDNVPDKFLNRSQLWNAVEESENHSTRRNTAQTAREIEVALPNELNKEQQIELMREYIKTNFIDKGMCADYSIHLGDKHQSDKQFAIDTEINENNPHAHIMLTTRNVTENGFENKNRDWNDKNNVMEWRKSFADITNSHLEKAGYSKEHFIDHRSLEEQGLDKLPTKHLGKTANELEKKGIETKAGNYNREVTKINQEIENLKAEKTKLEEQKEIAGQQKKDLEPQAPDLKTEPEKISQETTAPISEPTPKPEPPKADINDLKDKATETYLKITRQTDTVDKLKAERQSSEKFVYDFRKSNETIRGYGESIKNLEFQKSQITSIFKGKERNSIDIQINQLKENRASVAESYREKGYNSQERYNAEVAKIEKLDNRIEQGLTNLKQLREQKETLETEYKTQLTINRLEGKDSTHKPKIETDNPREKMKAYQYSIDLDKLTAKDLEKIKDKLPEHVKKEVEKEINQAKIQQKTIRQHREIGDIEL